MRAAEDTRATLMRAGLNLIQQALSIFDSDLRLVVSNQRFQDMFDFPDALVTPGAAFEDIIRFQISRGEYGPVNDPDAALQSRVEVARAFMPHYMERRRANGRWISVEGAPLPQGGWVTVYTDITEIKLQEALLRARSEELHHEVLAHAERLGQANRALAATNTALEETKRELTEMEARIRLTTEMMPAHIAHMDRDLRYTYSNRRLSSIAPGVLDDFQGMSGLDVLGAATFARIEPNLHRALSGEASVLEFTHPDSGRRIRSAFTPDQTDKGAINGVYILSTDMTEETQARAALMQTRRRELAAQLTSGLAHDFANLLTIILGLQSRLSRFDLPPEAGDLVAATQAATRRGGELLGRIASISGERRLNLVPVDPAAFGAELRTLAKATLPPGITLEIRLGGIGGPMLLDPDALQDVLVNLILNARDAMADRTGQITVSARILRETWVEFAVADQGPGFTPEALIHGIEPFFTTKGSQGSGLGLAMVYDHVTLAGGTVRLANQPGGGALVTLRLPLRLAAPTEPPGLVLLVEDSLPIRETIRGMLCELGHTVLEAASVDEAEALAALPGLQMVLSDIHLTGGRTGLDLAQGLVPLGLPLALMTSLPVEDPLHRTAANHYPVLRKPFDRSDLAAVIFRLKTTARTNA